MVIRSTDGDDGAKSPEEMDIWLCLSIPGISYILPSQGTAQNSSHSRILKMHTTNQLVHGHVSWACGVTPNCPLKGLEDGVTLETLGMKQQGMVYLSHIKSKKQVGVSQSYFSRNSIAWRKPLAMRRLTGDQA